MWIAVLTGLAMGVIFGFALEKSRVFEPGMIVGQMQLRNFTMLKMFLTAIATGAIVVAVLNGFGLTKLYPKPTFYEADILGGILLGAGVTLTGSCPGAVLAQIGAGYRDAIFTLLGGLAGAVAFGYAEPSLEPLLLSGGPGKITFATVTNMPYWVLAVGWAALLFVVVYWLEKWRPWRKELGQDFDGDFGETRQSRRADLSASRSRSAE